MSFPKYPKYKANDLEWLGDLPEHWQVSRLGYEAWVRARLGWKGLKAEEYVADGFAFLSTPNIKGREIDFENVNFIDRHRFDESPEIKLRTGDVLLAKDGSTLGTVNIVRSLPRPTTVNSSIAVITPNTRLSGVFLYYLFESSYMEHTIQRIKGGMGVPHLFQADLNKFYLPLPTLSEQTLIAKFLDRETLKIDELVAEQRRLIELLKEKRQAVISHAVTKGLNPNAPMKPSGVEWLGDVPEHWEVLPLKKIVAVPITDGPHETPHFLEEGIPFVSAEAVSSGCIDFSRVRACISESDNDRYSLKYAPKLHDIYMVKSGATTGVTAIVEDRTDFNIWSPLAAIRCGDSALPHFVLNFMRSRHFLEAVTLNWSFGTQQNIGMRVIENLVCAVPPLKEQSKIANYLKIETARLDALTSEAQRAVDLLQERRTALISAAVTGKIDVRGLVQTEAA